LGFFEDGDEAPRAPRPRRPARASVTAPDQQTLMMRRAVAGGMAIVLLILIVVGIKGCLNSQKKRSLRDYNRDVSSLVQESDTQVGRQFFELLAGSNQASQTEDLTSQVSQLRVTADELVDRAAKLDVPDQMKGAQSGLLLTLELRRDALARIAAKLPTALGKSGADKAVGQIAGQMQAFLASDVIYSQRVIPLIKKALDDNDVSGQTIASSRFLRDFAWLQTDTVAQRLGASLRAAGRGGGPPAPGLHGHSLDAVSVGSTTLTPDSANRIPAGANLAFQVKFTNGGENDEFDVEVKVTIEGGGKPIRLSKTVNTSPKGQQTTVTIPLGQAPPIGTPVTITVEVVKVPGEEKTDNNKQSYPALFTP
jgi:hypothetical protein